MACLCVHIQKELTGSDCGSQFRSVNTHWYLCLYTRLKIQQWHHTDIVTLNTASWYKVYLARPGWHFLISRAYSGNGAESVSDSHRSPLLCNSSYLCRQTLQIPSEQVYDLWSLWATTEIYSSVNITLSWSPSCHLTLLAKSTTELKKIK